METHVLIRQEINFGIIETIEKAVEKLETPQEVSIVEAAVIEKVNKEQKENISPILQPFPKPGSSSYLSRLMKGEVPGQRQHWKFEK